MSEENQQPPKPEVNPKAEVRVALRKVQPRGSAPNVITHKNAHSVIRLGERISLSKFGFSGIPTVLMLDDTGCCSVIIENVQQVDHSQTIAYGGAAVSADESVEIEDTLTGLAAELAARSVEMGNMLRELRSKKKPTKEDTTAIEATKAELGETRRLAEKVKAQKRKIKEVQAAIVQFSQIFDKEPVTRLPTKAVSLLRIFPESRFSSKPEDLNELIGKTVRHVLIPDAGGVVVAVHFYLEGQIHLTVQPKTAINGAPAPKFEATATKFEIQVPKPIGESGEMSTDNWEPVTLSGLTPEERTTPKPSPSWVEMATA